MLFLLIIAALVGGQTKDGVPRWFGWSLVAGGVLTFLLTLIPPGWWLAAIVPQLSGWPLILQIPAVAIMGTLFAQAGQAAVMMAVVLVIVGVLLVVLAVFLRRRDAKEMKF